MVFYGTAAHAQFPTQAGAPQVKLRITNPGTDFNNAITYISEWLNIQNVKFYINKATELLKSGDAWLKAKLGINAESLIGDLKNIVAGAVLFAAGLIEKGLSYL